MCQIKIYKNKQKVSLYMDNEKMEINDLVKTVKSEKINIVEILTIEQDVVLLSGYILFINERLFKKNILKACKAQVSF